METTIRLTETQGLPEDSLVTVEISRVPLRHFGRIYRRLPETLAKAYTSTLGTIYDPEGKDTERVEGLIIKSCSEDIFP